DKLSGDGNNPDTTFIRCHARTPPLPDRRAEHPDRQARAPFRPAPGVRRAVELPEGVPAALLHRPGQRLPGGPRPGEHQRHPDQRPEGDGREAPPRGRADDRQLPLPGLRRRDRPAGRDGPPGRPGGEGLRNEPRDEPRGSPSHFRITTSTPGAAVGTSVRRSSPSLSLQANLAGTSEVMKCRPGSVTVSPSTVSRTARSV